VFPNRRSTLLGHLEPLRSRLVGLLCLAVAGLTLLSVALGFLFPNFAPFPHSSFPAFLLIEAALAMIAGVIVRYGRREWAARVLAVNLAFLPTAAVLRAQAPLESGLAGYVGVLLVLAIGTRPPEVIIGTVAVVLLGAVTARAHTEPGLIVQSLLATSGLLAGTGIVLTSLVEAVRRAIVGLEASEAHFHHLSHTDPLTGLGNRRLFDEALADILILGDPSYTPALVVLDVDTLKQVNDSYGHLAGDGVLKAVSAAIRGSIRDQDIACRIGGDEFAVILAAGGLRGAQQIVNRVRERLPATLQAHAAAVECTVSLGIAEVTKAGQTAEDLLAAADSHLYANRNHVRKPVRPIGAPPA
jgi:diguanylate cyclase (GGDEF)-like protein